MVYTIMIIDNYWQRNNSWSPLISSTSHKFNNRSSVQYQLVERYPRTYIHSRGRNSNKGHVKLQQF